MAIILNATPSNGLGVSSDNSGVIQFQSNTVNTLSIASSGLMTAAYNGANPGVVPGMQYFRLNNDITGTQATTAQNIINVGVTLASSTVYTFDGLFFLNKSAGTTSHTLSFGFGGTATVNNIWYNLLEGDNATSQVSNFGNGPTNNWGFNTASQSLVMGARTSATLYIILIIKGTVSINAGGTFIPQYSLSAAPGGAYTMSAGSYMSIYPISTAGANVSIGSWA